MARAVPSFCGRLSINSAIWREEEKEFMGARQKDL
jgi:hypothetical protein